MICWPLDNTEYTSEALGSWLATRTRGVFCAENNLSVIANGDMTVTITSGLAWLKKSEFWGCSALQPVSTTRVIDIGDGVLDRIDVVVFRLDKVNNCSEIIIKKGIYSDAATVLTPVRDDVYDELYLATIYVAAGAVIISQENITDTRLNEDYCGLMRDGVTVIPTETLQLQVEALLNHLQAELSSVEDNTAFMLKGAFDINQNGVVDDSEKLGGQLPSFYASADSAMPKSGGEFSGDICAVSENRNTSCLRNSEVRIAGVTGTLQSTNKLIFVRK